MSVKSIKAKKYWGIFIYALLVLFCFYPYEFYSVYFLFLPDKTFISTIFFLALTIYIISVSRHCKNVNRVLLSIVFIQFVGYLLSGIVHGNILGAIGNLVTMLLAVALIYLIGTTMGLEKFFRRYNRWILLMAVLGTLTFFLITFFGMQPFYFVQDRAGGSEGKMLFNYILTFTKSDESIIGLIRYSGFFDEPGAMGYWGMYALVINQLFIKDKRLEIILIISLIFTLSLGYYVQVVVYLLLYHVSSKNIGQGVLMFFLIALVFFGIKSTEGTENGELYERTFGRIESIQNETTYGTALAVDDRESYTQNALREFQKNPLFGTNRTDVAVGNNVYETLALHGVVGTVFVLFPFILLLMWSIKYKDIELFKAFIVIILGFTHRPFHASLLYFFIIYCIVLMYANRKNHSKVLLG